MSKVNVAITGASGMIGKRLRERLAEAGNTALVIPRDAVPPQCDALVHLAGEPVAQRWNAAAKKRIHDSRVEGTRRLVNALSTQSHRPRVLVCASAVGYYGSRGDQILTEASSAGTDFLARVVVDWEEAAELAEALNIRVVRLRFGMVLGEGGALPKLLPPFRFGVGGRLGSGHQWMAWIHLEDAVNLILFALSYSAIRGAVNATAPHPVTNRGIHRPAGYRASPSRFFCGARFCAQTGFGRNVRNGAGQPARAPYRGQIRRFPLPIPGFARRAGQSPARPNVRDNRNSMRFLLVLVTAGILTAAGEMTMTVAQLVMFIRSSVELKQPDVKVAEYLRKVKLTDKLDDRTIEDLQSLGAGAKTVAALRELGDASAGLRAAPPPPPRPVYVPPPPPDSIEQARIIDETREYALNYTKQLPNFICVQVTRRDFDPTGTGNNWYHSDTITARLSYNGVENYEVILHNNQPVTNANMRQFGGTSSEGEFASMLKEIFEPGDSYRIFLGSLGQAAWPENVRLRLRCAAGVFALPCRGRRRNCPSCPPIAAWFTSTRTRRWW